TSSTRTKTPATRSSRSIGRTTDRRRRSTAGKRFWAGSKNTSAEEVTREAGGAGSTLAGEGSGREWRTRGGEAASQSEVERTTPPRRSSIPRGSLAATDERHLRRHDRQEQHVRVQRKARHVDHRVRDDLHVHQRLRTNAAI